MPLFGIVYIMLEWFSEIYILCFIGGKFVICFAYHCGQALRQINHLIPYFRIKKYFTKFKVLPIFVSQYLPYNKYQNLKIWMQYMKTPGSSGIQRHYFSDYRTYNSDFRPTDATAPITVSNQKCQTPLEIQFYVLGGVLSLFVDWKLGIEF